MNPFFCWDRNPIFLQKQSPSNCKWRFQIKFLLKDLLNHFCCNIFEHRCKNHNVCVINKINIFHLQIPRLNFKCKWIYILLMLHVRRKFFLFWINFFLWSKNFPSLNNQFLYCIQNFFQSGWLQLLKQII